MISRLPLNERLSVPKQGQTLLGNVKKWGTPFLDSHQKISKYLRDNIGIDLCTKAYNENYNFLKIKNTIKQEQIYSLCSAGIILNWVVGRAIGVLQDTSSLTDAEAWFTGHFNNCFALSRQIDMETQSNVLASLCRLDYGPHFIDIFPYATEVFETSDEIIKDFGPFRKTKRASGVFYTPSDVSDYIVDKVVSLYKDVENKLSSQNTWLDPACGTGCFLLSALYKMANENGLEPGEEALFYAANSLYGMDISPIALQSAAYILVLVTMQKKLVNRSLKDCLNVIGNNLLVCDSTRINDISELNVFFPRLPFGADFVVSNPPYTKRMHNYIESESNNMYLDFIYMMDKFSSKSDGKGGIVVPLSVAFNKNKEFHNLRSFMWNSKGSWWMAHFDRTPDSLFGDDVKIRNTIIFFSRYSSRKAVYTSDLIRWSSRNRTQLFKMVTFSKILVSSFNIIPKIGDEFGQLLLSSFYERYTGTLKETIVPIKKSEIEGRNWLRNNGTAYNWLPFELSFKIPFCSSEKKYQYWTVPSLEDMFITFALVQSRYTYWLWRVWGDGFHLTNEFIKSLPLSPYYFSDIIRDRLRNYGQKLWLEMLKYKVVSTNAGIVSTSYCPYCCEEILDEIDIAIMEQYNLPQESLDYLKEYVKKVIVAGRDNEIFSNPALQKWAHKERLQSECSAK